MAGVIHKNTRSNVSTPIMDPDMMKIFSEYDRRRRTCNYYDTLSKQRDLTEIIDQYSESFKLINTDPKNHYFHSEIKPNFNCFIKEAYINMWLTFDKAEHRDKDIAKLWQYLVADKLEITLNGTRLVNVNGASLISFLSIFNNDNMRGGHLLANIKTKEHMYARMLLPLSCNIYTKRPSFISMHDKLTIECRFLGVDEAAIGGLPTADYIFEATLNVTTTRHNMEIGINRENPYDAYYILHTNFVTPKTGGAPEYIQNFTLHNGGILDMAIADYYNSPNINYKRTLDIKNQDNFIQTATMITNQKVVSEANGVAKNKSVINVRRGIRFTFSKHDDYWNIIPGSGCFNKYSTPVKMRIIPVIDKFANDKTLVIDILTITSVYLAMTQGQSKIIIDPADMDKPNIEMDALKAGYR